MISNYRELIAATKQEHEPQRLLFVFCAPNCQTMPMPTNAQRLSEARVGTYADYLRG